MSQKKSTKKTAKKSIKKKVVKKNAKESVLKKKSVKKKDVKKKVTKTATIPSDEAFARMAEGVAGLMDKVVILIAECAKIMKKTPLVENNIETPEETNNAEIDLFPTEDSGNAKGSDFTKEDVTQALQKVSTIHGMSKVKVVLKKFKAERISDIYAKPDEYGKFISHCENVVATKPE